jgi:hypothetical protein
VAYANILTTNPDVYVAIAIHAGDKSITTTTMDKPPQLKIQERFIEIGQEIFTSEELAKITFIQRRNFLDLAGPDDLVKRLKEEFLKRSKEGTSAN